MHHAAETWRLTRITKIMCKLSMNVCVGAWNVHTVRDVAIPL